MTVFATDMEHPVTIPSGHADLAGLLYLPKNTTGIILFVHGSGSSRYSIRNQYVAHVLNKENLATLLFDLLTPAEDNIDSSTEEFRFNLPFLATRLLKVTNWIKDEFPHFPIGYFGASTGGGAALIAAAKERNAISAVVSRGGRPDLAKESLPFVSCPTLFIVGEHDEPVIELNQLAMAQMNCTVKLKIIPGATHLFEEPGTLSDVAQLAKEWFLTYLALEKR
ncbi:alpha/beta hydrolase [Legionella sp. MW5194]|uniref:dienelactone hydrolase family protein n=1 Tax=Legionella sp. MW5194 TaxID=2662448 RepID=UPI00193DA87B|nr:alpha/beta fold hydrolase [Legionella sp. MW5194]QRN03582.1 alpha/beta hydrolase [Legionella sp. MW5194]